MAPTPPIAAPNRTNHPPPAVAAPPAHTPAHAMRAAHATPVTVAITPTVDRHQQRRPLRHYRLRRRTLRHDDGSGGRNRKQRTSHHGNSSREHFKHLHTSFFLENTGILRHLPCSQILRSWASARQSSREHRSRLQAMKKRNSTAPEQPDRARGGKSPGSKSADVDRDQREAVMQAYEYKQQI